MPFRGVFPADKYVPAPYGLFSAAEVTNHSERDEHWAGGFDFESELCSVEGTLIDICGSEDPIVFHEGQENPGRKVLPFGIRASDSCLTPGYRALDRRARIMRQLEAVTQFAVEQELWAGNFAQLLDAPGNQYLTSDDAVDVTGGSIDSSGSAVKPKVGLALLEAAIAECSSGGLGTIHIPSAVGVMIGGDGSQGDEDTLLTFNGNKMVIGSGYDGRAPGASTPPANYFTPWIYATGPVAVDLGPKELVTPNPASAVNPRTNEETHVAIRPASVYWDGCCHFAVQVDIRL